MIERTCLVCRVRFRRVVSIVLTVLVLCTLSTQGATVYEGQVAFEADQSIISFPQNVYGLVFDSSDCKDCIDLYPEWRFFGNRKIDSLLLTTSIKPFETTKKVVSPLTVATQLTGTSINSQELLQVIEKSRSFRLTKSFPHAIPGDTLYWDSIRVKWHRLPDLSRFYRLSFDKKLNVDSVVKWLRQPSSKACVI